MRAEDDLQINRHRQGHRTYFLPGGAPLMGYKEEIGAKTHRALALRVLD